jgi:cytidine deaminase
VGVVAIGESGALYCGVNLEFPPLPINGDTVHGEQCAAVLAFLSGERRLRAMVTGGGYPCGHCRQFLCELAGVGSVDFLSARDRTLCHRMDELLPGGFYPGFVSQAPTHTPQGTTLFGEDEQQQALAMAVSDEVLLARLIRRGDSSTELTPRPLLMAAARACLTSHAPYTRCLSGIALQLTSGEVVAGCSLENVAFNPGMPPMQVALISLLASLPATSDTLSTADAFTSMIVHLVLVEGCVDASVREDTAMPQTSWEDRTRSLLAAIAPGADMDVFTLSNEQVVGNVAAKV